VVAIFLCSSLVGGFGVGGLCGWIGKALLYMVFWIGCSSVLYSSSCDLYMFILVEKSYGSVFVLGWMVGGLWDDSFCESAFPVYGYLPVLRGLVDGDVQVVYFVVSLCFCRKF